MQFPERELVAKKLDQAAGTPKLQAKDKGYWENQSCSQDSVTQECDYVVTVTPAGVNRPEPITASQIQTQQAYPAQPPQQPVQSPNAQVAQERQQQPVDQASIKSQLFRVNGCNHIKSQEFRTMESGNGRARIRPLIG